MIDLRGFVERRAGNPTVLRTPDVSLGPAALLAVAPRAAIRGTVAISVTDLARFVTAIVALDGRVDGLLLLPDTMSADDVADYAGTVGATSIVSDRPDIPDAIHPDDALHAATEHGETATPTRWMLTTSGTTGKPKIVSHGIDALTGTVRPARNPAAAPIWGLTYDPYRFAGLQVVLQAICGGGTLVTAGAGASIGDQIAAFRAAGVTHVSATPTHWRQFLMHPDFAALPLRQITLGGEIAEQPLLNALRSRFPAANVTHIYASTELGVGFSVQDGMEGFPRAWLAEAPGAFRLRIADGFMWVKSDRAAAGYLGTAFERDADGYVNSLDRVEERDDRIVFLGRGTGVINVGGAKVHPEMVERYLNALPSVALSRVSGRKNPFLGAVLVADVVPREWPDDEKHFREELTHGCRASLPPEAVPAIISLKRELETNSSGKLKR